MDFLKRVVKVEKTQESSLNLRRIFGPPFCGEIRAIHASGFIEFADVASAERALSLKLDIPGVRVQDVATQPHLVGQYRVINSSAFTTAERDDLQSNAAAGQSTRIRNDSAATRLDNSKRPGPDKAPAVSSSSETGSFLEALKSSKTFVSLPSGSQADVGNCPPPASAAAPPPSEPALSSSHSLSSALPQPPPSASPFICTDTHILMRLCGETISLHLSTLAGDPAAIIQLLKLTASERGNWLIVGAYYRRTGNPDAAKVVVSAMLEALKQFNIPENDLKPAFLLLSGCETDLAKTARSKGDPVDKIIEHYSNAQKWLHKVYGATTPALASDVDDSNETGPTTSPPRGPGSLRSRIDMANATSVPRSPDRRLMEREIQSLRDRYNHTTNVIADMRASKRKLEDTFEQERTVRRRLERDLNELLKERDEALRMEARAIDLMKREADSRQRAEDRAEDERQLRKRAESSIDFGMLQRPVYPGIPRVTPMAASPDLYSSEPYPAFGPFEPQRLSY